MRPNKHFWWKFDERNLEGFAKRAYERIISRGMGTFDPVFEAVSRIQDDGAEDVLGAEAYDSTALNPHWEMADFYASQWIIRKRIQDQREYLRKSLAAGRKKKPVEPQCSALDEDRQRCARPARFIRRQQSKGGNWTYQRRCVICFEKVIDPSKYERINSGRYF